MTPDEFRASSARPRSTDGRQVRFLHCPDCGELLPVWQFADLSRLEPMVVENSLVLDAAPLLANCLHCRKAET